MQKQQSSATKKTRFGFTRLAATLAVIFIAAIIINALPSFTTHAAGDNFIANLFGWQTANKTIDPTAVMLPPTVIVDPNGDGGFETGATMAANNWTVVNNATNGWFAGTATFASGTRSAYISNTSGSTYAYANATAAVSHFYRDITVPAGESNIQLSFKLKGDGDLSGSTFFDKVMVYSAPTTFTPTTSAPASSGTSLAGATLVYAQNANYGAAYNNVSVNLPSSIAGTTSRLIFTWHNDSSLGTVPGSVDDISVVSQVPVPVCGTRSVGPTGNYASLTAAFTDLNANGVCGAVVLELQAAYVSSVETFPITAGNIAGNSATNTITVRPETGATNLSISGAGAQTIDLNGAANVIFDGRPGGLGTTKQLTIANTSTTGTAVRFINDANLNRIQYLTMTGVNTSTTNGVVLFSTTSATIGNDNNTIDNCDIRDGATTPVNGIYASGSTTTTVTVNSGNTISNNNIFNFFSAGSATNGILLSTGNTDWTISGNSFYQTATRTYTTGATHTGISISNSSGNNFSITGNYIGGTAPQAGGSAYTIAGTVANRYRGISLSVGSTTATSVQGNTIANFVFNSSSAATTTGGPWSGIYLSAGNANIGTVTGNTIGSGTGTGSITATITTTAGISSGVFIDTATTTSISNNVIGSINTLGSTAGISHGFVGITSPSGTTLTINNNTIGSTTTANSITTGTFTGGGAATGTTVPTLTGIQNASGATIAITNNTIANLNSAYLPAAANTARIMGGIVATSGTATITGNTVRNLTTAANGTGTGSSASVQGIQYNGSSAPLTISNNTIFSLANNHASAAVLVTGIYNFGSSSGTNVIARNFIHTLTTTSTAGVINGIAIPGATTTYQNNMIDLGNGLTNSAQINGINETGGTNNFYHNSVYIGGSSVVSGAVNTFAFNSTVTANTRNYRNNIFYNARGNTSGTGVHYAIQVGGTAANPAGLTSNNNILFANFAGGGATGRFNAVTRNTLSDWQTATGQDGASIGLDPLYATPTLATPDLHIQAGSPAIDQAANVGVTNDFDNESRPGANTSFDIGADERDGIAPVANDIQATAFIDPANGSVKAAGVSFSPQASFTNNGTNTQTNVTVRYRICADAGCTSVIYNQTATIASINSGATVTVTFPSTSLPSQGTYTIKAKAELGTDTVPANDEITGTVTVPAPVSGTVTVGSGGTYSSLTNAGGIFQTMNTVGVSGNVTIEITSNLSGETGANGLNANAGNFSVTIKPQASVSPTITGSSAGCLININGADFVTIDGSNAVNGTTRDMTITNTSTGTSSAVVCLTSLGTGLGATGNTVKNTNIVGTTTTATAATLVGIFSGSSTVSITSTGADNDNNTIQNNNITKTSYGIYSGGASAANKNTGTVITQNVMNSASPNNITTGGVLANFEDGIQISRNDISVLKHDGTTGTTTTAFGIALGVVPNNTSTTFTGSDVINASVTRNKINGVTQLNSTGYSSFGIVVNSVTSGTTTLSNNMISGVRSAATPSDFSAGVLAGGGTGSTTLIYHNSVAMTGTRGAATSPSYGLAINSGNPTVDVKNNIFYNTQTSSSTGKSYAIANASTTFTNMTSNYNDLYVSGTSAFVGQTGGLGTAGTDRAALADWNTATGSDTVGNSKSADPGFTNPASDLHITNTSPAFDAGITGTGITTDFDGETRPSGAAPDMGADEVQVVVVVQPGTFQFNPTTYNTGEGAGTVTLTIERTSGSDGAVDVSYNLTDGTATGGASCGTAGVDFVNAGGTVNFANGETSKTFNVTICDDAAVESSEAFTAMLTGATNGGTVGANATATVTIADNDVAPAGTIQFSAPAYSVSEGGITASLTVTRTGGSNGAISANYTLSGGTATGGGVCGGTVDYVNTGGMVSFGDGDTANKTISVTICDDSLFEGDETFGAMLSGANVGSPSSATVTINDNDAQPSIQFAASSASVGEGAGTVTLNVTRTGATGNAVGASYTLADSGATGGASCGGTVDYVNLGGTVSFAAGETSKDIAVTICDDSLFESGTEAFIATLTTPTGNATIGSPSANTVTITDNDTQPSVQFSSATYSVAENVAGGLATITVSRSGATGNAVSVNYATVSGGSATGNTACGAGVDYVNASGTLNFAAGDTSKTFNVTICDDAAFEGNETVNLQLSSPSGATLGAQSTAVLTINDDESPQPGTIQFSTTGYTVSENGTNATLTVTRTGGSNGAISANYTLSGGTATGGATCVTGVDYINTGGTVSFADGDTANKTITVPICDDSAFEGDETFGATLSGANVGTPSSATVTITENDTAPTVQFSSSTYSITEGLFEGNEQEISVGTPTATITVTRTGNTAGASSVNYATSNGTATGGASCTTGIDYINASGTLNFAAGDTSKTFTVTTCVDSTPEGNETVNLTLSSPSLATLGTPNTAVLTINDNDSDTTAPVITYTTIPNDPASTTLTVTATDATGVTGVSIFWKINSGSYTSAPCSSASGTPQNGTWTCTITGASNPSAVSYYVTATDAAANTSSNPSGGASAPNLFTIGSATIPAGTYTNLTLGNNATLGGNVTVNGVLTLSGIVNTGGNTLTLECGATVTGGGETNYVVGNLEKRFCGMETFTYNVGGAAMPPVTEEVNTQVEPEGVVVENPTATAPEGIISNYSPLTVQITSGTPGSSLTVSVTDAFMSGVMQNNSISRYWSLTENGNLTANLTFTYRNEDVNGTETSYNVLRREGVTTANYPGGSVNAAANTFTAPGVTNFSQWSAGIAAPSAASATISGRVTRPNGQGIPNAIVSLTGAGAGDRKFAITNGFGYYTFEDVQVGEVYILSVASKRYTFSPPSIAVTVLQDVTGANFVSEQ